MKNIPLLTAQDVDARVQQVTDKGGAVILLYKNARVDMAILDEVFGVMNWQRSHQVIDGNLYCTVSVWDDEKKQWISKQDVGTESQTEKEKGQASDSFKRACFNLGIGRELYNAPFIFIKLRNEEIATGKSGKKTTYTKFRVTELEYNPKTRQFDRLTIVDNKGVERYRVGAKNSVQAKTEPEKVAHDIKQLADMVRVIDGYKYQLMNKEGKWVNVDDLSLELLNQVRNFSGYEKAFNCIDACIAEKSM